MGKCQDRSLTGAYEQSVFFDHGASRAVHVPCLLAFQYRVCNLSIACFGDTWTLDSRVKPMLIPYWLPIHAKNRTMNLLRDRFDRTLGGEF
jgi:hypothetical protein